MSGHYDIFIASFVLRDTLKRRCLLLISIYEYTCKVIFTIGFHIGYFILTCPSLSVLGYNYIRTIFFFDFCRCSLKTLNRFFSINISEVTSPSLSLSLEYKRTLRLRSHCLSDSASYAKKVIPRR